MNAEQYLQNTAKIFTTSTGEIENDVSSVVLWELETVQIFGEMIADAADSEQLQSIDEHIRTVCSNALARFTDDEEAENTVKQTQDKLHSAVKDKMTELETVEEEYVYRRHRGR